MSNEMNTIAVLRAAGEDRAADLLAAMTPAGGGRPQDEQQQQPARPMTVEEAERAVAQQMLEQLEKSRTPRASIPL